MNWELRQIPLYRRTGVNPRWIRGPKIAILQRCSFLKTYTHTMKNFKKVVFSADCQNIDQGLIKKAIHIAESLNCEITILDNIRDFSWFTRATLPDHESVTQLIEKDKQTALDQVVDEFVRAGIKASGQILHGKTSIAVLDFCEKNDADLILRVTKGAFSRELGHLGRTSKQLLRKSTCAVWLMHQQTKPVSENIMACIDTETNEPEDFEFADTIFEAAKFLKSKGHGVISIVHAWELWNQKMVKSRISEEEFEQWKTDCKAAEADRFNEFLARHSKSIDDHDVFLLEGDPSEVIPNFAKNVSADVVVMGTIGRSGFTGFLIGNTAERIFERVDCDVLALKHEIDPG